MQCLEAMLVREIVLKRWHVSTTMSRSYTCGNAFHVNYFITPQTKLLESYWIDLGHMTP